MSYKWNAYILNVCDQLITSIWFSVNYVKRAESIKNLHQFLQLVLAILNILNLKI